MDRTRSAPGCRAAVFLVFSGILCMPITVLPPLMGSAAAELGLPPAFQGALTSVPVLCFGLLAPAASQVVRRWGADVGVLLTLVLMIGGGLLRGVGGAGGLMAGTLLIGAGVTLGNIVVPVVIARDFSRYGSLMSGIYTALTNALIAVSTALAVPLSLLIGWRGSVGTWSVAPAVVALVLWQAASGRGVVARSARRRGPREGRPVSGASHRREGGRADPVGGSRPAPVPIWRQPLAWLLAGAFGATMFSYYALAAWLPAALVDELGMTPGQAGLGTAVMSVTGIVGPLLVPVMIEAMDWSCARAVIVLSACWLALPMSLAIAPGMWLVGCVLTGIAQAGHFAAMFAIVIRGCRDQGQVRRLSAFMEAVGYCLAGAGPIVMGWARAVWNGWSTAFSLMAVVLLVAASCGVPAARMLDVAASRHRRRGEVEDAVLEAAV